MPLLLSDLVDLPDLHLSTVTGRRHLDRPVLAAHASELVRPGAWLQGGELLMTIGLLLPMEPAACRAYVDDVAAGGAHALALGLGGDLPYQEAPAPLIDAATEAGLPLLTVGAQVPFIAVTKAVFAAQAAEQRAAVERAFATQRGLTAAAASGRGLAPTLDAWTAATGIRAYVTDPLGRVLAADGSGPREVGDGTWPEPEGGGRGEPPPGDADSPRTAAGPADVGRPDASAGGDQAPSGGSPLTGDDPAVAGRDLLRRVATGGLRSSAAAPGLEVQPLGARRLRGMLLLAGTPGSDDRLLVPGLVSLLSLELERRHLAGEPERRRRATLLGRLLAEDVSAEQAGDVLAVAGLASAAVRGVVVSVNPPADAGDPAAMELAADLALAVPGGLTRARGTLVEALVGAELDLDAVLAHFAPGRPAGIGSAVPPEAARVSLREAAGLVELSRDAGHPVRARRTRSSGLLLGLGDRPALAGYADSVLGPLDAADPSGALTRTLATWLDCGSSWDETARRLGLHRHTVRNRLDKAARLTGRRLDDGDDRFDLWLALRARAAAGPT
ncbi:PucR family transcriptional regulator [Streptomyces triticagri]|uniref:PucR family transcriptional regulator n=1 Tax=Streptomyces triticagri TaxID=2293568 RepID=A0A372M829_9ACTN|nr:PucR family transcriptional regulator [Streptomyces triticagri]RFU86665.1 PucR family transcriptional regulator [Streptomyces triticagri]